MSRKNKKFCLFFAKILTKNGRRYILYKICFKRRFMSRLPRSFINSNFFHVMIQGINREYIFEDEFFKKVYLKYIFEESVMLNINIISFCVMDNHVHLLLNIKNIEDMSILMKKTNQRYALFYNKMKSRVGYVFRNRYRSEPICDERYLYQCILYIHRNPIKARITEKLDEYEYSSTMEYSIKKVNKILNGNLLKYTDKRDGEKLEFIDIKENQDPEEVSKIIDKIILNTKRKLNIDAIDKKDKYIIGNIIKEIKETTTASMMTISLKLGISKTSVSRYINENKKNNT